MVIPMGSMGPQLLGPPPSELAPRIAVIKYCVLGMIFASFGRIVGGAMLGLKILDLLLNCFNLIINTVIGIFLLRDDPLLARIYQFLSTTCCQMCAEQCGGGMSCLMPFILCNLITVVCDLFFTDLSALKMKYDTFAGGPTNWPDSVFGFSFLLYAVAMVASFVSQTVGAIYGYLAYRQARDMGTSATPGSWGGGATGGGGGSVYQSGPRGYPQARDVESEPARPSRPSNAFQPFEGSGNRLGSNS
jgi:hypothetical protein